MPNKVPFPSREAVLEFIRESPSPVGKRELARAFHISGDQRGAFKALLKALETDGALQRQRGRKFTPPAGLPEIVLVEVLAVDLDGEAVARPVSWTEDQPPPRIILAGGLRGQPALVKGDRALAKVTRQTETTYRGRALRKLEEAEARLVGLYRPGPDGGRIIPADRRVKGEFTVAAEDAGGAEAGDLVVAHLLPTGRMGLRRAVVVTRIGPSGSPRTASLIAIHARGLPTEFSAEALAEAAAPPPLRSDGREDLRALPLVTIDGADARDFDDAVAATPDPDPTNPGGWQVVVAIADVAYYVRPGSALDRAAFERGNSVYFPDRVVPMLPEALSNQLCSLKPGEERACLAVHLRITAGGRLVGHRFTRALMRSTARLTYEQVQAARDGNPDAVTLPLTATVITPLYEAFQCLAAARAARGTLELDLPERVVRLGTDGAVAAIVPRPRLDSHRLIEEFMITANVAAAEALEQRGLPFLYRVHDQPSAEKLDALREFLRSFGYRMVKGGLVQPGHFTEILQKAIDSPNYFLINEVILRSQAQAAYSPENLGHFGLALPRYAHFTSPIRRYADLIVHRALIRALGLGTEDRGRRPDGLGDDELSRLDDIGDHVSVTERRAAAAERDALDRFTAAYLQAHLSDLFDGVIAGISGAGVFVRLNDSGADGLLPITRLPEDWYDHDEGAYALVGRRTGRSYRLGSPIRVRLEEADPLTGSTLFSLAEGGREPDAKTTDRPRGRDESGRITTPRGKNVTKGRRGRA